MNPTMIFLLASFALGWACQFLAVLNGTQGSGRLWLIAAMWTPLLAALLQKQTRSRVLPKLRRAGWRSWLMALVCGWSFAILQQIFLWISGTGTWNSTNFELTADHTRIQMVHHLGMALGFGPQGFAWFAVNLLVSVALGSLVGILAAIGEEAGWRGYLQEALESRWSGWKATLLTGLIWGYWHLPANLGGYNDPHHPVLQTLAIFPVQTVAFSFVLAWLVRKSGSIWPAALAHAANNTIQSGPLLTPNTWGQDQLTALLASVVIGALAAWATDARQLQELGSIPLPQPSNSGSQRLAR